MVTLRTMRDASGSEAPIARTRAATATPLQVLRPSLQPSGTDHTNRPAPAAVTAAAESREWLMPAEYAFGAGGSRLGRPDSVSTSAQSPPRGSPPTERARRAGSP